MTPGKRIMDIALVLVLFVLLLPVIALTALLVALIDGRPVIYRSERTMTPSRAFCLWKFRTMTAACDDSGVTGGDKAARIKPLGRILRRHRLDELPQLLNILRGDMSFVGPRPPLCAYVRRHPDLYARVLRHRPGVTGLATLHYHRTEERLLAACTTPRETDRVYNTRCIPRKARLDLIWAANRSLCFDLLLIIETAWPRRKRRDHAG
ncbi:MAG: sugar transferase [Pseudomonadota bacterium]